MDQFIPIRSQGKEVWTPSRLQAKRAPQEVFSSGLALMSVRFCTSMLSVGYLIISADKFRLIQKLLEAL
jgi:hypothetical protein